MKKNNDEIIRRINGCYVGDDCVQLMVPYKNGITILNNFLIVQFQCTLQGK